MNKALTTGQARILIVSALFVVTFLSVVFTVTGPGFGWDEVFYIGSGPAYLEWFTHIGTDAMRKGVLFQYWSLNHEHPPLAKLIIALGINVWGPSLGIIYSARLAMGLLFAVLVVLVFLFMARHFDLKSGVFAALSLLLMPRIFGDAHMAELDLPMALFWFLAAATFAEAVSGGWKWWTLSGLAFGLALLTKINALALPPVLVAWGLFFHGRKAVPACLCLLLGLPVFFLGWPWLWIDPIGHLRDFLQTLSIRTPIPVYYLGKTYGRGNPTPWHYPMVLTLATLPFGTVLASALGLVRAVRGFKERRIEMLLVANAAFILLSASTPGVPKYDGVRLFLSAFPFIACLAGLGLSHAHEWLQRRLKPLRVRLAWGAYFGWLVIGIAWMHPFYLSYYGGLVGGAWGAHRIFGFETTYWADVVDDRVIDFVVEKTAPGGTYVIFPHERLALDNIVKKMIEARRPDIREAGFDDMKWDVGVLNCRQGLFNEPAWELYRNGKPAFVHRRQGVPLCMIYVNDSNSAPKP